MYIYWRSTIDRTLFEIFVSFCLLSLIFSSLHKIGSCFTSSIAVYFKYFMLALTMVLISFYFISICYIPIYSALLILALKHCSWIICPAITCLSQHICCVERRGFCARCFLLIHLFIIIITWCCKECVYVRMYMVFYTYK